MKAILVLIAIIALTSARVSHLDFVQFVQDHGKKYHSDHEFLYRFSIFQQNMAEVEIMNINSTAVFGVTQFSDLTHDEFKHMYLMNNLPPVEEGEYLEIPKVQAPTKFDWRSSGAVTPVKNQGQCGSCWAFSATENIESVWKIAGHPIPSLSPQQMVDCDKDCFGCGGGWPYRAMNYIIRAGGQDSESSYPYTARNGQCAFKPASVVAKIKSYKNIPKNEQQIKEALATTSPFSICVDASRWSSYRGGVMTANQCGRNIDHCVQLVGYDETGAQKFWIVRNSWGTGWGESGYIRLAMGTDTCAMADNVATAVA